MRPRQYRRDRGWHGRQHRFKLCGAPRSSKESQRRKTGAPNSAYVAVSVRGSRRHVLELDGKRFQAKVEAKIDRDYDRMHVPDDATIVQLVQRAAKNLRLELKTLATGGGCDANVLNQKGLEVANLSTGMREIHTVNEWLDLKDLYLSAEVVLEVVRLNGASR